MLPMEIRMVKEFLTMHLKSVAYFIMTTLTPTLTITERHDAKLHYNWDRNSRGNCSGKISGTGLCMGTCPRECPKEEYQDAVTEWHKRNLVSISIIARNRQ